MLQKAWIHKETGHLQITSMKGNLGNIVTENLAELCSTIMWKAEFVSDELGYLAEEFSKQSVEGLV